MIFREAVREDVPAMLAIYAPYVLNTAVSFEYDVPTPEVFSARFENITAHFPWLVCEEDGQVIGYAYASRAFERAAYQWDADLSVYTAPAAHRRGIGRMFYALLEDILGQQSYHNIYAHVSSANDASLAFHRAVGYELMTVMPKVGYKLGAWHDMCWFHKRLCPPEAPAHAPIPFARDMLTDALRRLDKARGSSDQKVRADLHPSYVKGEGAR